MSKLVRCEAVQHVAMCVALSDGSDGSPNKLFEIKIKNNIFLIYSLHHSCRIF